MYSSTLIFFTIMVFQKENFTATLMAGRGYDTFKSRSECYCWPIIVYIIVFFVHWCRETDDIIFICLASNSTASAHRQVFHSWTGATQTLGASTTVCFGWHKSLTCKVKRKTTRGPIRCVSKPNRCVSKLNIFAGGKRERRSWWIWQMRGMYFWCECDVDCLALWLNVY